MKISQVTYQVEFTRNLGNFENVKPLFGATATLEDGDKVDDAYDKLTTLVDSWLTDKVEELETELKELGLGKN